MTALAPLRALLRASSESSFEEFAAIPGASFLVDWRAYDEEIAADCFACLRHYDPAAPQLSADVRDDGGAVPRLFHRFGDRRDEAALTGTPADRHRTLLSIDRVMAPSHGVRLVRDSAGSDTLQFVALTSEQLAELRREFGDTLDEALEPLSPEVELFGPPEPSAPAPARSEPTRGTRARPWWRFW